MFGPLSLPRPVTVCTGTGDSLVCVSMTRSLPALPYMPAMFAAWK